MQVLSSPRPTAAPAAPAAPSSAERAADQFEEVLVKQFVQTMTKGLFKPMEGGPGWMGSQADQQRDALADVLTRHLVDSGAMGIGDLVRRRWETPDAAPSAPPVEGLPIDTPIAPRALPASLHPLRPPSDPLDLTA
jgi:Rod binding domain-containing protein